MNQQGMPYSPPSGPARRFAQRVIDSIGLGRKTIETQAIIDAAIAQCGRRDFGDTTFVTNIDHLLLALEHGRSLSNEGRALIRQFLVDTLTTRAAVIAYDRQHPNVFKNPVVAPIVIVGLPCSGISQLQRILVQDADNRAPTVWESASPVPPPSAYSFEKDRRIDETDIQISALTRRVPTLGSLGLNAREAQDCAMILASNGTSELLASALHIPHYRQWMQSTDMQASYQWHKQLLQHLQSASIGRRWVLKSAQHLAFLHTLLSVYPDACVVFVHREPAEAIAEYWQLCLQARNNLQSHVDAQSQLHDEIAHWANVMDSALTTLTELPGINAVHVGWDSVQRRPLKIVAEIYAALGKELTPHACQRIETLCEMSVQEHVKSGSSPGRGIRASSRLLDINTMAAQTDRAFTGYIGAYGRYFR